MPRETLLEFLRQQGDAPGSPNWTHVRNEWLGDLQGLGNKMREWLDEPIAQHLLVWIQEMVTLQEEHLGTYEAPAWAVGRGTRLVAIRPVARLVVGAQGRVDVSYGPRHAMLLRTGPEVWKVRMPGANTTLVADLTPDTFADVLQSMLA